MSALLVSTIADLMNVVLTGLDGLPVNVFGVSNQ